MSASATQTLHEIFEVTSTVTFVTGILLNLLLLYLIRRFSTKALGTYKYLLGIFTSYDTFLVVMHYAINPKVIPSHTGFAVIIDREFGIFVSCNKDLFGYGWFKELTCFTSSCYAVPFVLLNIHFLYRYWIIREPNKVALFSEIKFIVIILVCTILVQLSWFLSCVYLGRPEDIEEIRHYQTLFTQEYGKSANDGCIIMNYWRQDQLSIRPFILLLIADSVEIVSVSLATALAILTYREIKRAQNLSEKMRYFHLRILYAAIAQTLTPVFFVYTPYVLNVNIPLFGIYCPSFSALSMVLLSCFPSIDAVVIIVLMKPYRDGLLSKLGRKNTPARSVVRLSNASFNPVKISSE